LRKNFLCKWKKNEENYEQNGRKKKRKGVKINKSSKSSLDMGEAGSSTYALVHMCCYNKIPKSGKFIKNINSFSHSSGGWKVKVSADLISIEGYSMLPRWHVLLCVHMAEGQKMPSYFP
jgi:hypothetical protein